MKNDAIQFSRQDNVGLITLSRPGRANAFDHLMLDQWVNALVKCRDEDLVKAIVITGEGNSFCAGVDFAGLDPEEKEHEFLKRLRGGAHRVAQEMFRIEKPIIAAINGAAIGAGFDMALLCDIRIASEEAQLGATYIKVGLFPGNGATYNLPKLIGFSRALELLWTGKSFTGRQAAEMGIVSHAVPRHDVLPTAIELAREIASMDPALVSAIKRSAYGIAPLAREQAYNVLASEAAAVRGLPGTRKKIGALKLAKTKPETASK